MNIKQQIQKSNNQVVSYIEHFLTLPFGATTTRIKLGTSINNIKEICSLQLCTGEHKSNIVLELDLSAKTKLYNQVFWTVFNNYHNLDGIEVQKGMHRDEQAENHWEINLTNNELQNRVVLEFAIQDYIDYMWIQNSFQSWDNKLMENSKNRTK